MRAPRRVALKFGPSPSGSTRRIGVVPPSAGRDSPFEYQREGRIRKDKTKVKR